jgi:hypothetical protein
MVMKSDKDWMELRVPFADSWRIGGFFAFGDPLYLLRRAQPRGSDWCG